MPSLRGGLWVWWCLRLDGWSSLAGCSFQGLLIDDEVPLDSPEQPWTVGGTCCLLPAVPAPFHTPPQALAQAVLTTVRSPAFSAALNADVPQRRFAVQLLCHLELLEHLGRGTGLAARGIDRRVLAASDRTLASIVDAAGRTCARC